MSTTHLVLGDQLSTEVAPWPTLPRSTTILLIESDHLASDADRHPLKRALYRSAMAHFAASVRALGYEVDERRAASFTEGLAAHRAEHGPTAITMVAPRGRRARVLFARLGVEQLPNSFTLTDEYAFATAPRRPATMEAFYRAQRRRLRVLMDGDEPVGGRWNFDASNRLPLPKDGGSWPDPWRAPLDELDLVAVGDLPHDALAVWPRTRAQALDQLRDAVERIIPQFGPYEDAASTTNWHLAHSRLSVALNLGLLHPREAVDTVESAFRAGTIPVESAEGFIRQVIGWREWVAVLHHARDRSYVDSNVLSATEPVPPSWRAMDRHPMACLDAVLGHLRDYGWTHHIERLMVLANAATTAGIDPAALARFMEVAFVDGAEWVMEANVVGMGTFADGGQTATKPYVCGGNYLSTMTDFCRGCAFNPKERTGPTACPLTTLYWNFFLEHEAALAPVHRIAPQRRAALARPDRASILEQAPAARRLVLS